MSETKPPQRIIIGITGASGTVYGIRALKILRPLEIETHLVVSASGHVARECETDLSAEALHGLADTVYAPENIGAAIASGSFKALGMLVAPCSMRTLAEIANGTTSSLLTRAADVQLKERRPLVLMAREAPLHAGHLRNMLAVTEMGGIIHPPVPAFYTQPQNLDDIVNYSVARALQNLGIEIPGTKEWSGSEQLSFPA